MYKSEHILAYACFFFTALPIFCIYLMFLGRWIRKKWHKDNKPEPQEYKEFNDFLRKEKL